MHLVAIRKATSGISRELRHSTNYVRNTHRQSASRALRTDGGLGFATGLRFDLFELSGVGKLLVEAFLSQGVGQGGASLRKWLVEWINGERDVSSVRNSLLKALSPERPTPDEREIVRGRLLDTTEHLKTETRVRLSRALGRAAKEPTTEYIEEMVVSRLRDAGRGKQADEIVAALAFGAVLDRARDATSALTLAVEQGRGREMIARLAGDSRVRDSFGAFKTASANFLKKAAKAEVAEPTSRAFARSFEAADVEGAIRALVPCVDQVLELSGASVVRGLRFRVVDPSVEEAEKQGPLEDGAATIEPDRTGRTFRIANFHSLLRDIQPAKSA